MAVADIAACCPREQTEQNAEYGADEGIKSCDGFPVVDVVFVALLTDHCQSIYFVTTTQSLLYFRRTTFWFQYPLPAHNHEAHCILYIHPPDGGWPCVRRLRSIAWAVSLPRVSQWQPPLLVPSTSSSLPPSPPEQEVRQHKILE